MCRSSNRFADLSGAATLLRSMKHLSLILVLVLVSAACGGSDSEDTTTTSSTSTSTTTTPVSTSTTTSATVPTPGDRWPLTGEAGGSDPGTIIAVKIDNTRSGRPQEGLSSADLVFEVLVEGGIPRLIALFQSDIPDVIGPVRSLREVDPKLVAPFGVLFANSGGDAPIRALLAGVATDVGDPLLGSTAYVRAGARSAPYNLMLTTEGLSGIEPIEAPSSDWLDFGEVIADGDQALTVTIDMSAAHRVNYRWSESDGAYLRFNGEQPHEDVSETQIAAANVIVVFARQFDTGRRDRAGSIVPDYDVVGTGDAILFRSGVAFPGTWERGSTTSFFRLFGVNGEPLTLATGPTWVQVVPIGRTVEWQ